MSLKDTLRKAAEQWLVEIPPEEEENVLGTAPPGRPAPVSDTGGVDLDRRLAEVNRALQKLHADPSPERPSDPKPAQPVMEAKPVETKTVAQIVRETEGPNLDQIKVAAPAPPPPILTPDGKVDFSAIYQRAKLPASPFTAEQMVEMVASLPPELPLEMKRQTVKVTLGAIGKAIGATPETILADTSRKLAALAAYVDFFTKQTAEQTAKAEQEVAVLQAQIEEKRRAVETGKQKQAQVLELCHAESGRLDDVLEFFSLDVPPSRYAPLTEEKA